MACDARPAGRVNAGCPCIRALARRLRRGIFPWLSGEEPIFWWSFEPRIGFPTDGGTCRGGSSVSYAANAFEQEMRTCAETPRPGQHGTWISETMVQA
ncbi:hypothetical protein IFT63_05580 [Stenotrophomonas sp. CFBP 13724]|nr:hypothetical protein [Stenotrophomonas sp. CFBP 13724]